MKTITRVLLGAAALLLCMPALVLGAYGYAAGAAVLLAAGYATRRSITPPRFASLLLAMHAVLVAASQFVGVPAVCAVIAMALFLFQWNAAHRFSQTESAPAATGSERRLALQYLLRAIPFSAIVGLAIGLVPLLRLDLSFGLALALALAAFLLIAGFVRLARGRAKEEA